MAKSPVRASATTDSTVFDSVFKTMLQKSPEIVIPLINEAFGRDYPPDEPINARRFA